MYGKLIFAGDEEQHVSMGEYKNATLDQIEISNQEGKIHADTPLWGIKLTHDTVIEGEDVLLTGDMDGYNLRIEKNYLSGGMVLSKNSVLNVEGDYRIQDKRLMEVMGRLKTVYLHQKVPE